jgi:hypothetical protein
MTYTRKIQFYFLTIVIIVGLLFPAYYVYDPLQVFHKTWRKKFTVGKNLRQQAAGIIDHYDYYDSVILGTCMMENTSAKEASHYLGGTFVNLSFPDGTYLERYIVLQSLFRQHKVKTVLYSLDINPYYKQKKAYKSYPLSEFDFLYDTNRWNNIKVYLNDHYLSCLMTLSQSPECIGKETTLDRPNAWHKIAHHQACYGGLDHWAACKEHSRATRGAIKKIADTVQHVANQEIRSLSPKETELLKKKTIVYLDTYLLSLVKSHPDTRFVLVDPPYSRAEYAIWAQYNQPKFELYKTALTYLARQSDHYPNLEVFSFGSEVFLDHLKHYKDLLHYHYSINTWMLQAISQKRGLIKTSNVRTYLQNITHKALDYNLTSLHQTLEKQLTAE